MANEEEYLERIKNGEETAEGFVKRTKKQLQCWYNELYTPLTTRSVSINTNNTASLTRLSGEHLQGDEDICYLDHAGATLYSEVQIKHIFEDLVKNTYGNPHSLNLSSKQTSDLVDQIRSRILAHFHTSEKEYSLIFTSGATAAIKILIENFDWEAQASEEFSESPVKESPPGAFIYTQSNHTSVVGGREIVKEKGIPHYCLGHESFSLLARECGQRQMAPTSNSLFAYPAQCNFSGRKYPLEWIKKVQNGALDSYGMATRRNSNWFCLLDAATFCSTNDLNLSAVHPDFVCISFYKIFGYPTGLGALLVRNSSAYVLNKTYFGGGTVEILLPFQNFHEKRKNLHARFEDGTISFLSIISLNHGLRTLTRLNLDMPLISKHVFQLARYAVKKLKALTHWNGAKVVEIYADSDYEDIRTQGGIINFNLKRANGQYVGFVEVLHLANLRKIYLRTGCFCNLGACQRFLKLSDADLKLHHQAGHICGDTMDIIHDRPTGSVRVSFGYMTTRSQVDKLLNMIQETFAESSPVETTAIEKSIKSEGMLLSRILIFPIKSCGAMEVNSWKLSEKGLEYDREWMIVTENGICVTQKQESRLCLILPRLDLTNRTLTLSFRKAEDSITIPIESKIANGVYDLCESKVCNDRIRVHDCGDEVAEWLCDHLQLNGLRLVRQAKNDVRKSRKAAREKACQGQLSLSNQAQYLLINNESVKWLIKLIGVDDEIDFDTFSDRFRGNFYFDGGNEFCENTWPNLKIGAAQFQVEGPCGRCQMICIDQHTGEKNRKPLVTLSTALSGKLQFGIYLRHVAEDTESKINVGDPLIVGAEN